jgi:hypothetical protein
MIKKTGWFDAPKNVVVESGTYRCEAIKGKEVESSKGTKGYKVTFVIEGGDNDGQYLWYDIWFANHNRAKHLNELRLFSEEDMTNFPVGNKFDVTVITKTNPNNGEMVNEVKSFKFLETEIDEFEQSALQTPTPTVEAGNVDVDEFLDDLIGDGNSQSKKVDDDELHLDFVDQLAAIENEVLVSPRILEVAKLFTTDDQDHKSLMMQMINDGINKDDVGVQLKDTWVELQHRGLTKRTGKDNLIYFRWNEPTKVMGVK